MARSCWCERMLAQVSNDPRLVLGPVVARFVWMMLLRLLREAPEPGILRFPRSVSDSGTQGVTDIETRSIARLVAVDPDEAASALAYLVEAGLLVRRDGALCLPEAEEAGRRAAIARENGRKGGRNKKNGDPPVTRQGRLLLAIDGSKPETQETRMATEAETPSRTGAPTAAASASKEESKQLVALGDELAEIAGLDPANGGYNYGPVQAWIAAGVSADAMRAGVRRVVQRPGWKGCRSLGYFDLAVREEHARAKPTGDTLSPAKRDHLRRLEAWNGQGEMPQLREDAA